MVRNYPIIKIIDDLSTVGFYEFKRVSVCPYGGVSANKHLEFGSLPESIPNKQLIVGNLYHELMDNAKKVSNKQELIKLSNEIFAKYERKYSQYIKQRKLGRIRSWSEIGKALSAALVEVGKKVDVTSKNVGLLVSRNSRFKGVPDKYGVINDEAYIVEYKSASIYHDGKVKDEYLEQVKYYSYLIKETFPDVVISKATLISLSGETFKATFCAEEIDKYGIEINNVYNGISGNPNRQKFDFGNCLQCAKKSLCDSFIGKSKEYDDDRPVFVLNGRLSLLNIDNDLLEAHVDGQVIKMSSIGGSDYLCTGKEYTFYNLTKSKEKYYFTEYSGIYEHN